MAANSATISPLKLPVGTVSLMTTRNGAQTRPTANGGGAHKLTYVIEEFRKLDPEMQAQTMLTFVHVCLTPDITIKELRDRIGVASSTISRNIAFLSDSRSPGRVGLGIVHTEEDPVDRRAKRVRLTSKGERVWKTLESYMRG